MSDEIEEIEYKGYVIKVYADADATDPREWDNLGTMLCKHRNYELGDVKESAEYSPQDIMDYVARRDVVSLPLYLLDHSGLWVRAGASFGDVDPGAWDSGMVGYITVTHERLKAEYSVKRVTKRTIEKALDVLRAEVKVYSTWLEGGFVGFVIESANGELIESCWGFDDAKYMVSECKEIIDGIIERDAADAAELVAALEYELNTAYHGGAL